MATSSGTTNSAKSTNTNQSANSSQSGNTNQSTNSNQSGNTSQSTNTSQSGKSNSQSGNKSPKSPRRKSSRRKSSGSKSSGNAFSSIHSNVTGTSNYFSSASPNLIFLVGGSLILASQWTRIKKTFAYAWDVNKIIADGPDSFYINIKTIGVLVLFIFILTITARAIPFLGGIWLVTLGGLWILWLMRNPEILQLLQSAGEEHLNSGPK